MCRLPHFAYRFEHGHLLLFGTRVCLKNSLIRNFGVFSAISASSILDLALLSLRIYSLN